MINFTLFCPRYYERETALIVQGLVSGRFYILLGWGGKRD